MDAAGGREPGAARAATPHRRPLEVRRPGTVRYAEARDLQARLVRERREGRIPDTLILLEHPHVITLGAAAREEHVLAGAEERERLGVELAEAGRGGDVTYHGPGQLVGYPILDLKPDRKDLHRYLRDLETVLLSVLEDVGVEGRRVEGLTGVWAPGGKVAALGVRVSSGWITSHGFALNVSTDLDYFGTIVPCGLRDRRVTSLEREAGRPVSMDAVERSVVRQLARVFDLEP